jgi:uncharacterized protein (TIGR03067 family)
MRLARQSWQIPIAGFLLSGLFGAVFQERPLIAATTFLLAVVFGLFVSVYCIFTVKRRRPKLHALAGLAVSSVFACLSIAAYLIRPDLASDQNAGDTPSRREAKDRPEKTAVSKSDQESLQGAWSVVSLVFDGKTAPAEFCHDLQFDFVGNSLKLTGMKTANEVVYTFQLDGSQTPKQIDLAIGAVRIAGIYELRGRSLRLCMPERDTLRRPKGFTSDEGSGLHLFVLQRKGPRSSDR